MGIEIFATDATEAEEQSQIEEGNDYGCSISSEESWKSFRDDRERSIMKDYDRYVYNKIAPVGTVIRCAENRCRKKFIKKSYQQAFCCTKHKNQFWNRQRLL